MLNGENAIIPEGTESMPSWKPAFLRYRVSAQSWEQMEATQDSERPLHSTLDRSRAVYPYGPRLADLAGLQQGGGADLATPGAATVSSVEFSGRHFRKEMRLVTGEEAVVARRIPAMDTPLGRVGGGNGRLRGAPVLTRREASRLSVNAIEEVQGGLRHWRAWPI